MELKELLARFNEGGVFGESFDDVMEMRKFIMQNRKWLHELNHEWHEGNEAMKLFEKITGKPAGKGSVVIPPFHTDFGWNITLGDYVFINSGCKMQDQGGIVIGDGTQLGHNVVLATVNHDVDPDKRRLMHLGSIHIGKNVWIGSGSVITGGVTIGDNAIIAAGAVVTKDVPPDVLAGGVPARVIKKLEYSKDYLEKIKQNEKGE